MHGRSEDGPRRDQALFDLVDLDFFNEHGYARVDLGLTSDDAAAFDRGVGALWREKPHDAAFAYDSPPLRFDTADEATQRKPRYRIHDLHSKLGVALDLYLHPALHRAAEMILGEPVVATQSLFFEYGSQQVLHRDSILVPAGKFGHLVAAWIALEDIDPRSGALAYVPGSHLLPFYEFEPGQVMFDYTRYG